MTSPSFADAKETRKKKMAVQDPGGKKERGTTCTLKVD